MTTDTFRFWEFENYTVFQVGADAGGEAFLLRTSDGATALFDTGFAFCAPQTYANIMAATDGAPVEKLLLTHSHYDHCAAAGYLLERMPDCKVFASEHAARVFTRPGAYETMRQLNASRADYRHAEDYVEAAEHIPVDQVLADGSRFSVGQLDFVALSAVGHTRCCLAFWCEAEGLFISSETSGVVCNARPEHVEIPDDVHYMVDWAPLVGYRSSIEHVERVKQLPIRVLVATHHGCIVGEEIPKLWRATEFWRQYLEDLVLGMHERGASTEEIIAEHKKVFYWGGTAPYQPEPAYELNASYSIPRIIADCLGGDDAS